MDPQYNQSSSLNIELSIIRVKNTDTIKSSGQLFVRCYLSAGDNKRIRLDTHQISSSSNSNFTWNQTFSLNCSSNQESIEALKQGNVVFELRSRKSAALPFVGSKVLGKAEIPWRTVAESKGMSIEKWIVMVPQKVRRGHEADFKPPAVQVAMRIQESEVVRRNKSRFDDENRESCGCCMSMNGDGCNYCCVGYEFFAIEAALELAAL